MISTLPRFCFVTVLTGVYSSDHFNSLGQTSLAFSQALFRQIALRGNNVVYSPYSVRAALSLLLAAAGDKRTYAEINSVAFGSPPVPANVDFKSILLEWNNLTEAHLYSANGIFLNPHFHIEQQYVDAVLFYYFAQSANFDYSTLGGPERAINEFVERQTYHQIRNLLPPHSINSQTLAVLVNTIYFNGTWEQTFNPGLTDKADFHPRPGFRIQIDTMHNIGRYNIIRNVLGADVIELPYHGNFALYIALPQAQNGLTQLENYLTVPGAVNHLFQGFNEEYVQLSLPKLRIESEFRLKQALQNLGIRRVFNGEATLSGISHVGGLSVSEIFHKAVIEVQEYGTVATAATAVKIDNSLFRFEYPHFKVDHPFIFFLKDRHTNIILFHGVFSGEAQIIVSK